MEHYLTRLFDYQRFTRSGALQAVIESVTAAAARMPVCLSKSELLLVSAAGDRVSGSPLSLEKAPRKQNRETGQNVLLDSGCSGTGII